MVIVSHGSGCGCVRFECPNTRDRSPKVLDTLQGWPGQVLVRVATVFLRPRQWVEPPGSECLAGASATLEATGPLAFDSRSGGPSGKAEVSHGFLGRSYPDLCPRARVWVYMYTSRYIYILGCVSQWGVSSEGKG